MRRLGSSRAKEHRSHVLEAQAARQAAPATPQAPQEPPLPPGQPAPQEPPRAARMALAWALARGYVIQVAGELRCVPCILKDARAALAPQAGGGMACPGGHLALESPLSQPL